MSDAGSRPPLVIGKDISWNELAKHNKSRFLRVTQFAKLASVAGDTAEAVSLTMPYGISTVECLEARASFGLPITHRLDFLHLCQAHDFCQDAQAHEAELTNRAEEFKSLSGRHDFLSVYSRVWGTQEMEVIVRRFVPMETGVGTLARKMLGAALPMLVVLVCPKGYLELMVSRDWPELDGFEFSAVFRPLLMIEPQV